MTERLSSATPRSKGTSASDSVGTVSELLPFTDFTPRKARQQNSAKMWLLGGANFELCSFLMNSTQGYCFRTVEKRQTISTIQILKKSDFRSFSTPILHSPLSILNCRKTLSVFRPQRREAAYHIERSEIFHAPNVDLPQVHFFTAHSTHSCRAYAASDGQEARAENRHAD